MSFVCSLCGNPCEQVFKKNICPVCYLRCHVVKDYIYIDGIILTWYTDYTSYGEVYYFNTKYSGRGARVFVNIKRNNLINPAQHPIGWTNLGNTCDYGIIHWI